MNKELGLANLKLFEAMQPDASVVRAIRALESGKLDSALRAFKALDTLKLNPVWLQRLKVFESSLLDPTRMSHFKALETRKIDPTLMTTFKALDRAKLEPALTRSFKAYEAIKLDPVWMKSLNAIDAFKANSTWARTIEALGTAKLTPILSRYAQVLEPLKLNPSLMRALETPLPSGLRMDKLHDLVKTWQTSNPLTEIEEVMDALSSEELVDGVSSLSTQSAPGTIGQSIAIEGDGYASTISTINIAEVQAIVDRVVDRAADQSSERLTPLIASIADELRSMKSSPLKTFFLTVIFPILLTAIFSILNPVADYYVKRALEDRSHPTTPREVKKNVRKNAPLYAESRDDLKPYRVISRRELTTHSHASSSSPAVANLQLGQVVVLLEKRKDWSRVAWRADDDSSALQGWVFTRYATRIV